MLVCLVGVLLAIGVGYFTRPDDTRKPPTGNVEYRLRGDGD